MHTCIPAKRDDGGKLKGVRNRLPVQIQISVQKSRAKSRQVAPSCAASGNSPAMNSKQTGGTRTGKRYRCSACGELGHNAYVGGLTPCMPSGDRPPTPRLTFQVCASQEDVHARKREPRAERRGGRVRPPDDGVVRAGAVVGERARAGGGSARCGGGER